MGENQDQFSQIELRDLARRWLAELRGNIPPLEQEAGGDVVSMNFEAPPEIQWQFILMSVSLAESDDELGHIAAGPIEHLLGWHGDDYISVVEREAATNAKFARALTGVWQYLMSDEVWSRLQGVTAKVADPLRPSESSGDA